jgi:hypothetical protein
MAEQFFPEEGGGIQGEFCSVVDPDPVGSKLIFKLRSGSESVINFGSEFTSVFKSGSKLSSVSN